MKKDLIELNTDTYIDLPNLIYSRLLVQANSGAGKSWTLRRILEQSYGKVQQIILDTEGEFSTLREKNDYILAGKGGDTPADPRSAALLARKLLEVGVSAIIDLYELHPQDRKRFVKEFLTGMINSPKELWHECLVVVDEAHIYAPEKGQSEALDAVIGLMSLGRKRGFCGILATQRISKLHKDAAAECNNKLIGRTGLDIDMKRAGEELGFTSKEQFQSLRKLQPGEFYAFGSALSDEIKKVTVGAVTTSHPKAGNRGQQKITPPSAKIKEALSKLGDLPEEAKKEAQTVSELKQEIVTLNRKINQSPHQEKIDVQKLLQPHIEEFARTEYAYQTVIAEWGRYVDELKEAWDASSLMINSIFKKKPDIKKVKPYITGKIMILGNEGAEKSFGYLAPESKKEVARIISKAPQADVTPDVLTGVLKNPEQRILTAIAWANSIGIDQPSNAIIAFLSGYSNPRSTGYTNPRGQLTAKGMIRYPSPGLVELTEDGLRNADVPSRPGSEQELQERILKGLTNPQARILKVLIDAGGQPMSNEDVANQSGYSNPRSTGYTNPRGNLMSFGLIDYPQPGFVQAKALLFLK